MTDRHIDWRHVGCGCQLDAAGHPFVDHCVCLDRPVEDQQVTDVSTAAVGGHPD